MSSLSSVGLGHQGRQTQLLRIRLRAELAAQSAPPLASWRFTVEIVMEIVFAVVGMLLIVVSLATPLLRPDWGPLAGLSFLASGAFLMAAPYWRGPVEQGLVNILAEVDWRLFTTVFLAVALALILFGRRLFRRAES